MNTEPLQSEVLNNFKFESDPLGIISPCSAIAHKNGGVMGGPY